VSELHPVAKSILMTIGKIGYRSLAAAVSTALRGAGEISEEIDQRIKRAERSAKKMADGEPYAREDEDHRR
jgi:hypothetical protein